MFILSPAYIEGLLREHFDIVSKQDSTQAHLSDRATTACRDFPLQALAADTGGGGGGRVEGKNRKR